MSALPIIFYPCSLIQLFWDTPRTIYSGYIWGWWGQDVDDKKLIDLKHAKFEWLKKRLLP